MDQLLKNLNIPHERDVPLGPLTWYGVGGNARLLARPSSVQQLSSLVARAHELGIRVYVLGSGANLLVRDEGVDGLVIQLSDPHFKQMKIEGTKVTVGAGYDLAKLVLDTARAGLAGLECLAGVPASVGGAIRMNAGGAYGEIGPTVRRLQVMDASGHVYYRDSDDLVFSYRKTNIVARLILEAQLELEQDDPEELVRRVKEIFLVKKNSQPLADRSAGCAFKNPPAESFPEDSPHAGWSAGKLIDTVGLKGFRIGGAEVSNRHANFVTVDKTACASDVLDVIDHVRTVVKDRFGVELEREVVVWP
ncbi:MAG: UDP-N-acetylmuramate dehydrogenase [Phycisphaera sp.]|nr:UDP-N-acetylmuramate dehydrogenase [Phycisphaera sp.]